MPKILAFPRQSGFPLIVFAFALLSGGFAESTRARAATCAESSVTASQVRTRQDVEVFVRCAKELLEAEGTDTAYQAFHEDERWRWGRTYIYVSSIPLPGNRSTAIVYPPDPNREGLAWPPFVDRFGLDLRDERVDPALAAEQGEGTWRYYDWRNPATGETELKTGYVIAVDWDGTPAFVGTGIYEPDIPGACAPETVNAWLLTVEPSDDSLRAFVRCAAYELESKGFFAQSSLTSDPRWSAGASYVFGVDLYGGQLFTGSRPVTGGPSPREWGDNPKAFFGDRDLVGLGAAFGESFLYYSAVNPMSGTVHRKVGFVKRVNVQGKTILVGSGYYVGCMDGDCDPLIPVNGQIPSSPGGGGIDVADQSGACPAARQWISGIAKRSDPKIFQGVNYGFYTDFHPLSYASTQDSSEPAFNQPVGYEPDLVAAVDTFAGKSMSFDSKGIGNPFSGIWLKSAQDEYDMVGGGITALTQRMFNESGAEAIRFGVGHVGFRQSLLVRESSDITRHSDLTSDHRIGVLRGTTGEARLLVLTGIADADGVVRAGTQVTLEDGSVIMAGAAGTPEELRISAAASSDAVATRVRLTPAAADDPQVLYLASEDALLGAVVDGSIDAVARGEIGNSLAASETSGLQVTAIDTSATERGAFSYPATSAGDELREVVNAVVNCLTDGGRIGILEWLQSDGSVFQDRARSLR